MPFTDVKINYYLRQQKSIERKMFCHLFKELNSIFEIRKYRYVGMGAKYFVDFILFHREFGFENMISIEADEENREKYDFNKPLKCIEMNYNYSSNALHRIDWVNCKDNIIWMDYDEKLSKFMLEDIETSLSKLNSGGMFFISYNSEIAHSPYKRLEVFKDKLKEYCPSDIKMQDLNGLSKNKYTKRIINNVITTTITKRNLSLPEEEKLVFQQLTYFIYKDGVEMITVGGVVLNTEDKKKFDSLCINENINFVVLDENEDPYSLMVPPLTYKEMNALLQQLPCSDITEIVLPGLQEEQIRQISKVYRYYPFYLEAASFN